jgi:hypothetical protein
MRRLLSLILVFTLAACSAPAPTSAVPEPTAAPATAAAAAPTATVEVQTASPEPTATVQPPTPEPSPTAPPEPISTAFPADPSLTGAAWEWTDSLERGCDLLIFQEGGVLSYQSGCKAGEGSYQQSGGNLQLALPPDIGGDLTASLAGVSTYALRDGMLVLTGADGKETHFAPLALLPVAQAAEGSTATLKYNTLVYLSPHLESPVIGVLPAGTAASVAARIFQYDWWGLRMPGLPDGYGWIAAKAADITNVDAIPYTQPELLQVGGDKLLWPEGNDPRASVSGEVRIYAGPSESYVLVMAGLPGDTFYVLGKSADGAYLVVLVPRSQVSSGLGWVKADTVETRNLDNVPVFKAPPAPGVSRFMQPAPGQPFASAMTFVNIRGGPGVEYTTYKVAERGDLYLITGVTEDHIWYRIKVPTSVASDGIAWISAPNVRAFDAAAVTVVPYPFPMPALRADTLGPACQIVSQSPREFEIFKMGFTITLKIEIRNNTDFAWTPDDIDFVYIDNIDNAPMHVGPSRLDLEETVIPGNSTVVEFDAKTPTKHIGTFGERWVVRKAGGTVCAFTYQVRTRE